MELRDLRYFCVTAELEHVTKAAGQLNIAQPYLTRVIHQLEEEVGGPLFDKSGRRIKLNSNGEVFYRYAKSVLADMDRLHAEMAYLFDTKEQSVTFLCSTESFSIRLMEAFNKQNADYSLAVLQTKSEDMAEELISGRAQFALSSPPLSAGSNMGIIQTDEVFHDRGYVICPPGHPLLRKSIVTIDDLRGEKLVTMPKGSAMSNRLQPIFDEYNYQPKVVFESFNLNMVTRAVLGGLGYAFVTGLILADYPEVMDLALAVDVSDDVGHYGLSYNRLSVAGRNTTHFKNFVVDFLSNLQSDLLKMGLVD